MVKITISSFADFIEKTVGIADTNELLGSIYDATIYRGQPVEGNLIPSIARGMGNHDTTDIEKNLLKQLGLMGASLLPDPKSENLDLMVIAQHFGLMTRLLDWTSNPLAALWFACSEKINQDAKYIFVYALNTSGLLTEDAYSKDYDPFTISDSDFKPMAFQPRLNNVRIIAQHGFFTLHRYSTKANRFVPLEDDPTIYLTEFRIPVDLRDQILMTLACYGISNRTLFPDLQGLCRHLNWKYKDSL